MTGEIWYFEWKDELNIGAPEIDRDHQEAISLISVLIEATLDMQQLEVVLDKMQAVVEHTQRHFAKEQAYLTQWRYRDLERHVLEHTAILRRLGELTAALTNNTSTDEWTVVALKVRNTLIDHFLVEDMKFKNLHLSARTPTAAKEE